MESGECQSKIRLTDDVQMKEIDRRTVEEIGLPAIVLMETAAHAIVDETVALLEKCDAGKKGRVLAIYGTGGNGGDAIAASRLLHCKGYRVDMMPAFPGKAMSETAGKELEIAKRIGVPEIISGKANELVNKEGSKCNSETYTDIAEQQEFFGDYSVIIDGIFGVGLSRDLTGEVAEIVDKINASSAKVLSADIPSGIHAGNGSVLGTAVKADVTVTFGERKIGQFAYPGKEYCGKVVVADIGFPKYLTEQVCGSLSEGQKPVSGVKAWMYGGNRKGLLPKRAERTNKGTFGKVMIFAGSKEVTGAAVLAAKAAYRSGVGIVQVVSAAECIDIIRTAVPEAMTVVLPENPTEETREKLRAEMSKAQSVLAGPGIGQGDAAKKVLEWMIELADELNKPLVLDADAVNLISMRLREQIDNGGKNTLDFKDNGEKNSTGKGRFNEAAERIRQLNSLLPKNTILTPHPKELSRLLGTAVSELLSAPIDIAKECIYNSELIFVLKDAATIVAGNGELYVNTSGCNGMATGGSGDVLAGIIAGLLTNLEPSEAATLGVYLHGLAGEKASEELGTRSMLAGDMLEAYPKVLKELEEQ